MNIVSGHTNYNGLTKSNLFFFTSDQDDSLVTRSLEYRDNVIPSSNSIMAKNLFKLSHYFDNSYFADTARTMLNNVKPEINEYASGFSNWMDLMLNYAEPYYEVAVCGADAMSRIHELNQHYLPNKLIIGSTTESTLALLKNRYVPDETFIYVCVNKACKLPVRSAVEAIKLLTD